MDNIAHGLVGSALALTALWNTPASKYIGRTMAIGALLANAPDLDFIIMFFSKTQYALEHRGLTHSFLGGVIFLPLYVYILKWWYQKKKISIPKKDLWITSIALWAIGHVALDYFTVYGVQLLYPFNNIHYDYTIMFIIDVFLWIGGVVYIIGAFYHKKPYTYAAGFLIGLTGLYGLYAYKRIVTVQDFEMRNTTVSDTLYTILLNPFIATTTSAVNKDGKFIQTFNTKFEKLPLLGQWNFKVTYPQIPKDWVQNALPDNGQYSQYSQYLFKRYQDFGKYVLCRPVKTGALCVSLKYVMPSIEMQTRNSDILNRHIPFNAQK